MFNWFVRWSLNHPHQRHLIEGGLCAGAGAIVKFAADYLGAGHVDGLSDSLAVAAGGTLLLLSKDLRDKATSDFLAVQPTDIAIVPVVPSKPPVALPDPIQPPTPPESPIIPHG